MVRYTIENFITHLRDQNAWYRQVTDPVDDMSPARPVNGVNICGYLRDESGLGAAARRYVQALDLLDMPVALVDLSELTSNRSHDTTLTTFTTAARYDVNLLCIDAGQHYAALCQLGAAWLAGRYNIGIWAWELPRFPKWYDRLAFYDEIWVGTSFIANALAPISPIPVVRIPPALSVRGADASVCRRRRATDDPFIFLFVFDFHSHLPRKNPLALIAAFKRAFVSTDPVRLIIKCVNGTADHAGYAALSAAAGGYPIDIYDGYWPAAAVQELMDSCDAYVSLHRSEGTGLTITDAMALGKPVIATGWSGNMDFMDVTNSFPVRYDLVELTENIGPYSAGELWADPSIEHAAELMRLVFFDRDQARARAVRAKRDIEAKFSASEIACSIQQRLTVIATRHRFPIFRREMQRYLAAYGELVDQIRATASAVLPADARVLVISKGDNALLELAGRWAAHFPQEPDGAYLGYYPADSIPAIEHLEALRAGGAQFLLLPGTAFWWLEHYPAFAQHLAQQHKQVWDDECCKIYRLCRAPIEPLVAATAEVC